MASFDRYFPFLKRWEGEVYENDKDDPGGPTKYGITLEDWKMYGYDKNKDGLINAEDVKLISEQDAKEVVKKEYWDVFRADEIKSQSVAEAIVDFGYNAGKVNVAKKVQSLLGVKADGVFGPITIAKINTFDSYTLFQRIQTKRRTYYKTLVLLKPKFLKFYKGWNNRTDALLYKG